MGQKFAEGLLRVKPTRQAQYHQPEVISSADSFTNPSNGDMKTSFEEDHSKYEFKTKIIISYFEVKLLLLFVFLETKMM